MGTPRPDDAPRARAARAFPPLLVRSRSRPSFDRTRLTSPPPCAARSQILAHQPSRAARLNRDKSTKISVANACNIIMKPPSPLVRRRPRGGKRVSDTTPDTSRGPPRATDARTRADLSYPRRAPPTRIVAGTSTRRAPDARGRDPVLPPGTRAPRSPAATRLSPRLARGARLGRGLFSPPLLRYRRLTPSRTRSNTQLHFLFEDCASFRTRLARYALASGDRHTLRDDARSPARRREPPLEDGAAGLSTRRRETRRHAVTRDVDFNDAFAFDEVEVREDGLRFSDARFAEMALEHAAGNED